MRDELAQAFEPEIQLPEKLTGRDLSALAIIDSGRCCESLECSPGGDTPMKVLVAHPRLGRGGSEVVVAWMVQMLALQHQVSVATMGGATLSELDAHAGMELERHGVNLRIPRVPRLLTRVKSLAALRGSWFLRQVKAIAGEYDLLISGYEYLPFGYPAIHYVHGDTPAMRGITAVDGGLAARVVHGRGVIRRLYMKMCALVAGKHEPRPSPADILIANSSFTASNVLRAWGRTATVIHPPIPPILVGMSWVRRANTVVMLGRIDRSKRLHEGIQIVSALRGMGHRLQLCIVGTISDTQYLQELMSLGKRYGRWLTVVIKAASVLVAPIFSGSGTRLKILEALVAGTSGVTTAKGMEGLPLEPGSDICTAESSEQFTAEISRCLEVSAVMRQRCRAGTERARESYDWSSIVADFLDGRPGGVLRESLAETGPGLGRAQ